MSITWMFRNAVIILMSIWFLSACKEKDCIPYFEFDKVDHYSIVIPTDNVWYIQAKENKSVNERKLLDLLEQDTPLTLSDTPILRGIEKLSFVRRLLPDSTLEDMRYIFCERKHAYAEYAPCIPIYRDILVFRKKGQIIGVAKICFECFQSSIIGTDRNTEEFGQSGDFYKLKQILHSEGVN